MLCVDVLQIFAGAIICSEATFADKVLALFDLFDMDMNKVRYHGWDWMGWIHVMSCHDIWC